MIAVTGATGTNGKLLIARFKASGRAVRALVRHPRSVPTDSTLTAVEFDFDRPETFEPALAGAKKALLLAPSNPKETEWETAFISAAKRAGVEHIVYFSALGADAPQPITIGKWHADSEAALRASGLRWTILRPGAFMQNFLGLAAQIAGGTYAAATGSGKVSYIDARDITDVIVTALTRDGHEGKAYDLTGPEALDGNDAARILSAELGRPVHFTDLTRAQFEEGIKAHVPSWYATALGELFDLFRAGYGARVTQSVAEVTGHAPRAFSQFVREHRGIFTGAPTGVVR
jgi:uncharacterized protein YbjT (DUF2867 family)